MQQYAFWGWKEREPTAWSTAWSISIRALSVRLKSIRWFAFCIFEIYLSPLVLLSIEEPEIVKVICCIELSRIYTMHQHDKAYF